MKNGSVKWFSAERGFGFIQSDNKDYFAHFKEIDKEGFRTLDVGQKVTFIPGKSAKGDIATSIKVVE